LQGNLPWEYDQLNLVCPWYRRQELEEREEVEQYIIYSVSREEYDSCIISQKQPRVVAVCNKPDTRFCNNHDKKEQIIILYNKPTQQFHITFLRDSRRKKRKIT
jgi:hypothetical protein